jgi:uncharacterized membrane protein
MGGIDTKRWLLGGLAAGVLIWLIEGVASMLYAADMQAAMTAHNLSVEMSAGALVTSILMSVLTGLVIVFIYAMARARLGPGPRTAVVAGVAFYLGSTLLCLLGWGMLGLYPARMLVTWAVMGLVEVVLAALLGGFVYREKTAG